MTTRRRLWPALALVAAAVSLAVALARRLPRLYRVEVAGPSMLPALYPGDFLLLRRGRLPSGAAAFGQVVATRDASGRLLLKRVVGLPGESLRVGTSVQVNGRVLLEGYANGATPPQQYRGLNRLAEDEYFLLGDHRSASTDSRDFGPVHADAIEGVAVLRYWPPERAGRLRRPTRVLGGADPQAARPGIVGGPGRPARAETPSPTDG